MVVGRVVERVGLLLLRLETAKARRLATVLMTAGLLLTLLLSAERSVYSSSY